MPFKAGDPVIIVPKVSTGEVVKRHPYVSYKFNVRDDPNGAHGDYTREQLKKIPYEGWVNTDSFSYRVVAQVVDGVREASFSNFRPTEKIADDRNGVFYRFDGVSHRGGRIK